MPSNAERRERFLRVSKKRLKKALDAIESISSLDGDHYKFDNEEISKIFSSLYASLDYGWLSFKLKNISTQDKLNFLFEREVAQYEHIKKRDPVFYSEIKKNLPDLLINYIERKEANFSNVSFNNFEEEMHKKMKDLENNVDYIKKEIGTLTIWMEKNNV